MADTETWGEVQGGKYEVKKSATMVVKTRTDGVEMSAHSALVIKFSERVMDVSLLLTEDELAPLFDGAAWAGVLPCRVYVSEDGLARISSFCLGVLRFLFLGDTLYTYMYVYIHVDRRHAAMGRRDTGRRLCCRPTFGIDTNAWL